MLSLISICFLGHENELTIFLEAFANNLTPETWLKMLIYERECN